MKITYLPVIDIRDLNSELVKKGLLCEDMIDDEDAFLEYFCFEISDDRLKDLNNNKEYFQNYLKTITQEETEERILEEIQYLENQIKLVNEIRSYIKENNLNYDKILIYNSYL